MNTETRLMVNLLHGIPAAQRIPTDVNMITEIPSGGMNKYELDSKLGIIQLDRVLHMKMPYPIDYGFIPQTWNTDDDPLDIFCFTSFPTFPGCLLRVRAIGVLRMIDSGEKDNKIVAVPVADPRFSKINSVSDLAEQQKGEIRFFFEYYKKLQKKEVLIKGWFNSQTAKAAIQDGVKRYKEHFTQNT